MGKTKQTTMGDHAGILKGLVNTAAGKHAVKTTGGPGKQNGYGSTKQRSQDDYTRKNSKK